VSPPSEAPPAAPSAPPRRWLWPAIVAAAVVWAIALGGLAFTHSNEPTLNRVQFERADALVLVKVESRTGGVVRAVVRDAVPAGRLNDRGAPVPEELAEGTTVTIANFPQDAATPGSLAAAPVRRIGGRWTVAEPPKGLPRLVYSLSNPGDWSDLKAAAEAFSAGRDPYR